jgi:hypothetical protein
MEQRSALLIVVRRGGGIRKSYVAARLPAGSRPSIPLAASRETSHFARSRKGSEKTQNHIDLLIHRVEEILVGLRILHLVEQEFHCIDGAHLHEDPAEHPHFAELALFNEQFFLTRARFANVERGEDALVRNLTVENDFAVASAFELFKDHFIHSAAGIDQRGRDD